MIFTVEIKESLNCYRLKKEGAWKEYCDILQIFDEEDDMVFSSYQEAQKWL